MLSLLLCITLNGGGTTRQAEAFTQRANQNILKTAQLRQHRWQKLRNQAQSVKKTARTRLSSAVIDVVHTQVTPVNDVATSRSTSPSWRVRRSHLTARHRRRCRLSCPVLSSPVPWLRDPGVGDASAGRLTGTPRCHVTRVPPSFAPRPAAMPSIPICPPSTEVYLGRSC